LWDTEFTAWEGSWQRGWSEDWEHREIISIAAIRVKWATDGAGPRTMPELLETMGFAAAACKATNVPDCLVHFDAGYTASSVALRAEAGL